MNDELTIPIPMRFVKTAAVGYLKPSTCNKCGKSCGEAIWMAHSEPFNNWETDSAYGDFIYCEPCFKVLEVADSERRKALEKLNGATLKDAIEILRTMDFSEEKLDSDRLAEQRMGALQIVYLFEKVAASTESIARASAKAGSGRA